MKHNWVAGTCSPCAWRASMDYIVVPEQSILKAFKGLLRSTCGIEFQSLGRRLKWKCLPGSVQTRGVIWRWAHYGVTRWLTSNGSYKLNLQRSQNNVVLYMAACPRSVMRASCKSWLLQPWLISFDCARLLRLRDYYAFILHLFHQIAQVGCYNTITQF